MSEHADKTLYGVDLLRALCDESGRADAHDALDALLAERDNARAEWRAYSERETELMLRVDELEEQRQQAIEALREIAQDDYRVGTFERRGEIAREALAKLGEQQ